MSDPIKASGEFNFHYEKGSLVMNVKDVVVNGFPMEKFG
jgi:hypothetical protein